MQKFSRHATALIHHTKMKLCKVSVLQRQNYRRFSQFRFLTNHSPVLFYYSEVLLHFSCKILTLCFVTWCQMWPFDAMCRTVSQTAFSEQTLLLTLVYVIFVCYRRFQVLELSHILKDLSIIFKFCWVNPPFRWRIWNLVSSVFNFSHISSQPSNTSYVLVSRYKLVK
jgi:hypothetical protein